MALDKATLEEYAALKIKEKEIKARMEELMPVIKQSIEEAGADKVELPNVGNFLITKKKVWVYSEEVGAKTQELKALKDTEEADGTATFEETSILMFKETKKSV